MSHICAQHTRLLARSMMRTFASISGKKSASPGFTYTALSSPQQFSWYNAYLQFFTAKLLTKGVSATLEESIFSRKANAGPPGSAQPPLMLPRFLATILHPMIHAGCGIEFGLLGLVAEGKSMPAHD